MLINSRVCEGKILINIDQWSGLYIAFSSSGFHLNLHTIAEQEKDTELENIAKFRPTFKQALQRQDTVLLSPRVYAKWWLTSSRLKDYHTHIVGMLTFKLKKILIFNLFMKK